MHTQYSGVMTDGVIILPPKNHKLSNKFHQSQAYIKSIFSSCWLMVGMVEGSNRFHKQYRLFTKTSQTLEPIGGIELEPTGKLIPDN